MEFVIVSRHLAAIQFIREADARFADAPVLARARTADDVRGMHVAGNLPMALALLASSVTAVEFEGEPPRGAEYSLDEMRAAGARLTTYVVCDAEAPNRVARLVEGESNVWAAHYAVRAMLGEERAFAAYSHQRPATQVQSFRADGSGDLHG